MTLDDFVKGRLGTVCTHPRGISGQCVCLIRCYFDDVLKLPQFPGVRSAKDLWNTLNTPDFIRIPNSLFATPRIGDIFVMDAFKGNPHGHTGIILDGASFLSFPSFDSNFGIPNHATYERHGYLRPRVLGWFRKRSARPTIERVNEAIRECGDDPARSVGTLTLSRWWQNRVAREPKKFTNDEAGYQALVGAIKWHQVNHKYPHNL